VFGTALEKRFKEIGGGIDGCGALRLWLVRYIWTVCGLETNMEGLNKGFLIPQISSYDFDALRCKSSGFGTVDIPRKASDFVVSSCESGGDD